MEQDRNFKVLVISDNYAGLDILNSILSLYYSVRIITSVDDALEFIKSADLDLIILDCAVLNCNCYDFFIKIKSLDMTKRIPIILIGDSSQPETEEIGFALGAVDYISKPFRSAIVKVRVNNQRMLIKHIKTIEKLGMQDYLTGLPNRRGFDNRINLEWLRATREKSNLSLAVADIDFFKAYNDEHGHTQGDVLLRTLAKHFLAMLRRPADFVARWGGEEFAIILPNTELKGAVAHCEEIRKSVEKIVLPDLPPATISIGVASIIPSPYANAEELFGMADKALYQAKNTGRNKVCF